jgi:hypothetical protein
MPALGEAASAEASGRVRDASRYITSLGASRRAAPRRAARAALRARARAGKANPANACARRVRVCALLLTHGRAAWRQARG